MSCGPFVVNMVECPEVGLQTTRIHKQQCDGDTCCLDNFGRHTGNNNSSAVLLTECFGISLVYLQEFSESSFNFSNERVQCTDVGLIFLCLSLIFGCY